MFDRFYKVEASRVSAGPVRSDGESPPPGPGGSGLGLSIVKAIVEPHGARISVSSHPGRTIFEISGLRSSGNSQANADSDRL